jgi:hypothetical protein
MLPELLAYAAAAAKLALRLRHLALGAVPEEEQPALLLLDVQLPLLELPLVLRLLAAACCCGGRAQPGVSSGGATNASLQVGPACGWCLATILGQRRRRRGAGS